MARLQLTVGTRYTRDAQVYLVRQVLPDDQLVVENHSFGGQAVLARDDLYAAWARGEVCFEIPGQRARSEVTGSAVVADFDGLPAPHRAEAWRRYELIKPLLVVPPQARTRQAIDAHVAALHHDDARSPGPSAHVSRASITRYLRAYEGGGRDIRALVPAMRRQGGPGRGRLDPALERIVQGVLAECAAAPRYRTVRDVYLLVVARVRDENLGRAAGDHLPLPGRATIHRRVRAGAPTILRRRPSPTEAHADAGVHPAPRPTRILERVEIDHTTLDLILVDEEDRLPIGRPTITLALDVYSGFPHGVYVGFEPAGYAAAMRCLLHGILPKEDVRACYGTAHPWPVYGLPETLVVDNAPHLVGHDLADACAQLGVALTPTPVRRPWFKGAIERQFRTHNTGLIHTLPGTTFSNMLQRGAYDAAGAACISLTRFWEILHVYLLDLYARDWHAGVGGVPAIRWDEAVVAGMRPALYHDAAELRILLGRAATRTLQRTGIDFQCLRYQSPALDELRRRRGTGATVTLKYDPEDLGALHALDPAGDGRWLRVPAVDQAYAAGLSLWKHQIIHDYALRTMRDAIDIYALAAAKEHIRAIVDDEFRRTRRGRRTLARAKGIAITPVGDPIGAAPIVPAMPPLVALPRADDDAFPLDDAPGWGGDYNLPRR